MIIEVCQGQPEIALRIVQPGCDGGQIVSWEQLRLVIRAPNCNTCCVLLSDICFHGCWPGHNIHWWNHEHCPPHLLPALVYPAFNMDDYGRIVFLFDDLLFKRPPGRYLAEVQTQEGRPILEFDLDLCTRRFVLDEVIVTTTPRSCS